MKRNSTWATSILLPVLLTLIISSCQKEITLPENQSGEVTAVSASHNPVTRAYRDSFDTWYMFVPDIANGWDPTHPTKFLAWYPGGGDGNASHIGNAKTYFNQYVPFAPPLFSSVPAPVTQFFSAPLAAAGFTGIPSSVSSIVYDSKGNSVWFHQTSNSTIPASSTRINFSGTADIIGGTGKFSGATGEVSLQGFFNPQDQQDASFWQNGWIRY